MEEDFLAAEKLHREIYQMRRASHGDTSTKVAEAANNLAYCLVELGRMQEAEEYYRQSIAIQEKLTPNGSPTLAQCLNNFGRFLTQADRRGEAKQMFERVLEMRRGLHGDSHSSIANTLNDLGKVHRELGELDRAEERVREAEAMYAELLGPDHLYTVITRFSLALVLNLKGDFATAEPILQATLAPYLSAFGEQHARTVQLRRQWAFALAGLSRPAEAAREYQLALDHGAETLSHEEIAETQWKFGRVLLALKRFAESESMLLAADEHFSKEHAHDQQRIESATSLVDLYEAWDLAEPEKGYDAKARRWKEKVVQHAR
jgi:tetratricopeptide (TPR) repeat protein